MTGKKNHILEHLNTTDALNRNSEDILKDLIEFRAQAKDNQVHKQLLKKLVLSYSDSEKRLFELNNLKNKFLGIAAHDLRNPLTSIRGFCEIILEEPEDLSDDNLEMLNIIHEAAEGMLRLVNDLLDISVIESGKLDLQKNSISMKSLIEDKIKMSKIVAARKDIRIEASLPDVHEAMFDKNRIEQAFDNFVGNAVKFSPSGTTIYILCAETDTDVSFSVRDEGPGISEEDQGKLFGEFQRLTAQPTGGEKSTGLGLSIVKKIINAHNGNITVKSELGKGTTFKVSLPRE
ncbi:sensor histidine kinase [Candidatus Latescibacterota bacterium]